jgi:hypothetical protein
MLNRLAPSPFTLLNPRLEASHEVASTLLAVAAIGIASLIVPTTTAQALDLPGVTLLPFYSPQLRVAMTLIGAVDSHFAAIGIYLTFRFSAVDYWTEKAIPDSTLTVYANGNIVGDGAGEYTVTRRLLRDPRDWAGAVIIYAPVVQVGAPSLGWVAPPISSRKRSRTQEIPDN